MLLELEEHPAAQDAMNVYRNIKGFLDPTEAVRDYVGDALKRIRQMMMDLEPHERDAIAADLKLKAQAARVRADRLKAALVNQEAVRDEKIAEANEMAEKYANIAKAAREEEEEMRKAAEKAYRVATGLEEESEEGEERAELEKQDSIEKDVFTGEKYRAKLDLLDDFKSLVAPEPEVMDVVNPCFTKAVKEVGDAFATVEDTVEAKAKNNEVLTETTEADSVADANVAAVPKEPVDEDK